MFSVGAMVWLTGIYVLRDEGVAVFVLSAVALPFLVAFLANRGAWWFLIPAYVILSVALMVGLIGLGVLEDLLIPAYIMMVIALPFFVVYFRDRKNWWALIPAGIMTITALSFLIAESLTQYVAPVVLILVGVWLVYRQFTKKEAVISDRSPSGGPTEEATPVIKDQVADQELDQPVRNVEE